MIRTTNQFLRINFTSALPTTIQAVITVINVYLRPSTYKLPKNNCYRLCFIQVFGKITFQRTYFVRWCLVRYDWRVKENQWENIQNSFLLAASERWGWWIKAFSVITGTFLTLSQALKTKEFWILSILGLFNTSVITLQASTYKVSSFKADMFKSLATIETPIITLQATVKI